jgi:plastocyanin
MKGMRALASAMLVLAAICVVPAVSLAQDAGTPADTTTTTTPVPEPAQPADPGVSTAPDASPTGPPSGTPTEPLDQSQTTEPVIGDRSPADGRVGGAHKASSTSVTIQDFFFSPGSVTVDVGDTVTWRNSGQAPHNATANDGSFKTPDLNNGQSASHTFSSPGTFSYICTIHPNMHGTVRVLSAGGSGGGASSTSSGTSESSAVASPDAAGTSTTLPMTGLAAGALALTGLALLASGLLTRWAGSLRRWLSLF